jgi:hypothetical protein
MHAKTLLHKFFEKSAQDIHKKRLEALFVAVESLLYGRLLTLSGLGQSMPGQVAVKHCIKRVNRLLGNTHFHADRVILYKHLAEQAIGKIARPIILIDWSQLDEHDKYYVIRATVPFHGRGLTIYEDTYPKKAYDTHGANKQFLLELKHVLPSSCKPIIVTDAGTGFRTPWLKEIAHIGWDFVSRIRGKTSVLIKGNQTWLPCHELYLTAKTQARHLGRSLLTKQHQFVCDCFLAKRTIKKRSARSKKIEMNYESNDRQSSRRAREPWLLATSLNGHIVSPNTIISIYKQRMQIEESFRDSKNERLGFSLKKTLSQGVHRLNILLLIGTIASYVALSIGKAARTLTVHYQFQATSVKTKPVVSLFNLGCQIWLFKKVKIPIQLIQRTLRSLNTSVLHLERLL